MKKFITFITATVALISATAIPSLAATVDLPPEFATLSPILEFVLKLVEFISKIADFFSF